MNAAEIQQLKATIKKCRKSVTFFMENFCKIKHPSLGVIPFSLFEYQKTSLREFRTHRFNIFKKCRQSGVSTLSGNYALWFAMMHSHKTVLIVSKRDLDAKDFLDKNVKFVYQNLPDWMKQIWKIDTWNEHEVKFTNGSLIRSLTSGADTLRSNASSLNIIDEAAFMPNMETMWSGGFSTLQHGGSVIVISTCNGVGNWYWGTWMGAKEKTNDFNPIEINWWDMDWSLEFRDPISGKQSRIAPTDGIRECTTKEDIDKYGPYWSPWLEGEYRGLESRGEAHLFKQEVLAEFIGSGGTVVSPAAIRRIENTLDESPMVLSDIVPYDHPITGDIEDLDFTGADESEGLWIWNKPVSTIPAIIKGGRVVKASESGHSYVIGVDVATGRNNDFSTIEVIDIDTMEQVAEYRGRVQTSIFCKMVDYIGRWYNNALVCIERTGVGSDMVQDMIELSYPNLWRRTTLTSTGVRRDNQYGFATSEAGKPTLNKALIQNISENDGEGYIIKSIRLWKELQIYIRKRGRTGNDTNKTGAQDGRGNHDDLVIAIGLAFLAAPDAMDNDPMALLPARGSQITSPVLHPLSNNQANSIQTHQDMGALMPFTGGVTEEGAPSPEDQLMNFANQLYQRPRQLPAVSNRRRGLK